MPKIHPSASVEPTVVLADDTVIGPGAVLEGDIRIGPGCEIQAHAVLTGNVEMGANNRIGYGAVIGSDPQDLGWKLDPSCGVRIGSGNQIREYCTIHRATKHDSHTTIGDDNYLMTGVHMGHDSRIENGVIIANNCLLAGHVTIQDKVVVGGGSVFHQFIRVGRLSMIQGISGFGKDVPPFTMGARVNEIHGLNTIGLRRGGFSPDERKEIQRAFRLVYRDGLNLSQALEAAADQSWGPGATSFFDFIRNASKRGICGGPADTSAASAE